MKVLILGAQGNLGQQLMKVFWGSEVVGMDASELDVTNKELVLDTIKNIKPAVIINATAYNAVDKCEGNDEEFEVARRVNTGALGTLSQAALSEGAVLVHYSTDYVFDGEVEDGYGEGSEPSPINKYGVSKLGGEKEITALAARGLKYYIIRTSRLFGPQGKSRNAKQNFFDLIYKKSKESQEISAVTDEVASFAYTPDLALATKNLLEQDNEYGIYHIVNSGSASWYEAARELLKILNRENYDIKPISGDSLPRPARRPRNSVLRNTKIESLRSWQDALREYAQDYIID